MSEQKKKAASETEKVETPKIPHVAYPLKPRSNTTNLSQQYFNHLAGDESARFLFNNSGLWHQGIHLRASKFPSSEFENNKICAIADGKLIAYKVDSGYKTDNESESSKESAVYSTGFFLLKHEVAYPKDNVLTFYSLYRHTAKLGDYKSGIEEIVGITKSSDNKIVIRDAQNHPLNPRVELNNGVTIGVRRQTQTQDKFDELLWYRETKDNKTIEHKPKTGERWRIFHQSYEVMQSEQIKGLPLLSKHKIDTQADVEVKLNKAIAVKAGEVLGLMGEYNQMGERGEKLLHLEVFTYDDIEQFKAKAETAYKQDREKKGIKDNFLYVARGSQLYSIANDEAVALEKTQVEIMVPLADVAKQTVKDKQNPKKTKAYYNVQPYLYSLPHKNKEGGIYVDESHLTHGLLFPGVNIFNQSGNGLCIFKHPLHQNIDPKSDLTVEQKNELDPMFKSMMDELDLEKDKNASVSFEAGKLKDLLLSPVQQRRLTGIVAKHDSEWKKTRAADFKQVCDVYRNHGKEDRATRIEKRVEDLSIKLEVDGFNTDKQAYYLHPLGVIGWLSGMCMPLKEAKETALIISGTYEGKGGFASLSGNFDNMGMSWGIVQFNFGQNTLGPLLIDMRNKNTTLFNGCFSNNEDLSSLNKALDKGTNEQMKWAIDMQNKYNSRWKDIFNKLAEIREFQEIQIEHADKYIKTAINIIRWMRGINPSVMEKVEFKTFAAMVDLSIQQGGIDKVKDIIKAKSLSSPPNTQYEFAKLVVEERGSTASARWRADCISRRLGILNKKTTSYSHSGYVAKRDNSKFSLIKEVYICEL